MGVELDGLGHDEKKNEILRAVLSMSEQVGVIETLGDLGVKKSDLPRLAATAIRDPCLATNPRKATPGDLEKIYEQAL